MKEIIKESDFLKERLIKIAEEICIAARTAPKTRGIDVIETAILFGDSIKAIIEEMRKIYSETNREAYKRNSESLENTPCIVLIGAKRKSAGLNPCGLCGFKDCEENEKNGAMCVFNIMDLGIAIGSAVSILTDKRIDNRLMWTIGIAAKNLKLLDDEVKQIIGIPLSATGKNIFFDRK